MLRRMSTFSGQKLATVVKELENFAPITLAEKWDNVGLLIEPHREKQVKKILLTNDLTEPVMSEALTKEVQLIISYHPPIFKPLTRVTQSHWKERVVAACLANDIALYSPHTAWDKACGGVNDWLSQAVDILSIRPLEPELGAPPGTGSGRYIDTKMELSQVLESLQKHIGNSVHVALAVDHNPKTLIQSVGICAGSGGSLLKGIKADLIITGEMSHHEVLEFTHNNTTVLLCNHSNSERGFLKQFSPKLSESLKGACEILVSETDKDPLVTVAKDLNKEQSAFADCYIVG
ncbi:NIF3-like protein 1 [Drosophila ficusphila]|uniref:NIF3-like protein 1 n=1 Tax=Drosophila ficusphila TaxID=30025 RepID=UPI0007E66608|nr:NIF3-like protein 1 [Drosophila ficusphila]